MVLLFTTNVLTIFMRHLLASTGHDDTPLRSIVDREGLAMVRSLYFLRQTLALGAGDPPQTVPFCDCRTCVQHETDGSSLKIR